jgi:tetratricopeptide (TPR) repeat protein
MNIENLQKLLDQGQDNLLLRFGLGQALLKDGQVTEAIIHLEKALEFDPAHSASLKLLGKAYATNGDSDKAIEIYSKGIELAEHKGDVQAAKEMKVFLKRLLK